MSSFGFIKRGGMDKLVCPCHYQYYTYKHTVYPCYPLKSFRGSGQAVCVKATPFLSDFVEKL